MRTQHIDATWSWTQTSIDPDSNLHWPSGHCIFYLQSIRLPIIKIPRNFSFFTFKDDIEIPIPKYFTYENSKVLQEREKMLGSILAKMGPQETTPVSSVSLFLMFFPLYVLKFSPINSRKVNSKYQ